MSENILAVLGISSGVVNLIGLLPYLRDILRHKTKPERVTWWIWSVEILISLAAQVASGATWSLGLTIGSFIAIFIIAVLSLSYGYGTFHRRDYISLVIAAIGVVLWLITDTPLVALLIIIGVDLLAFWLTIDKTWKAPDTETLSAWIFAGVSAVLGALAVGQWKIDELIYPAYLMSVNWVLVWVIVYRRRQLRYTK